MPGPLLASPRCADGLQPDDCGHQDRAAGAGRSAPGGRLGDWNIDHIADKVSAIVQRYGDLDRPSTRFKDLVDLVAIVSEVSVTADLQIAALRSEADRRGIALPATFDVPDREIWARGYAAEAGRSLLLLAGTLDEALRVVRPFVEPLLAGTASGRWDLKRREWVP